MFLYFYGIYLQDFLLCDSMFLGRDLQDYLSFIDKQILMLRVKAYANTKHIHAYIGTVQFPESYRRFLFQEFSNKLFRKSQTAHTQSQCNRLK